MGVDNLSFKAKCLVEFEDIVTKLIVGLDGERKIVNVYVAYKAFRKLFMSLSADNMSSVLVVLRAFSSKCK